MLKLSLPGVDPGNIPTLTAEQVAQIPGVFLDFLHEIGQVTDLGDLKIITLDNDQHNFTITSIARWIANGRLETGELRVEQLQRKSDRAQITYDPNTHEKDIRFVATAEIHAHFLQRLGLYGFSISAKIDDLQAYLCKTIRTEYPVYEAELIAIVTTVFKHTDDLRHFDSALAGFVSERMFCLREILVNKKPCCLYCARVSVQKTVSWRSLAVLISRFWSLHSPSFVKVSAKLMRPTHC